jgi:UDP-N-acetylglucosamine/UDP-N-acetylgalactosamine diphosphorylase
LPHTPSKQTNTIQQQPQIAKAPDGNGGLYRALHTRGALADMRAHGLEALDVYCVDNALARVGDPEFVGACAARRAEVGARVLAKASPEEKVGVFAATADGRLQVRGGCWAVCFFFVRERRRRAF